MSFAESLQNIVFLYCDEVSKKFNIDRNALEELWRGVSNGVSTAVKPVVKPVTITSTDTSSAKLDDLSPERLNKCTKVELEALCRHHAVKVTGKKDELIERLIAVSKGENVPKPTRGKKTETASFKTKNVANSKEARAAAAKSLVEKILEDSKNTSIPVRPNKFGNLEHPSTGIVFDRKSMKALGKQEDDGTLSDLTEDDIEFCKQNKYSYNIPENLDKNLDLKNVKIEELDEDSDIEIKEEPINEEDIQEDDEEDEDEVVEIEEDEDE